MPICVCVDVLVRRSSVCVRFYHCAGASCGSLHYFFFFQAEDGIRDLVRSRGLGDVYKRQAKRLTELPSHIFEEAGVTTTIGSGLTVNVTVPIPVSYTHLTLPTSDLV